MDTQRQEDPRDDGYGEANLNTSSAGSEQQSQQTHHKGGIHNNALYAASMGRAATAGVDPHTGGDLANTGTNVSYEGTTASIEDGFTGTEYTPTPSGTEKRLNKTADDDNNTTDNAKG